MKKILFVSIAFPPKSDPESIQVMRYAKYFDAFNYDVLTSKNPTLYMETDNALVVQNKNIVSVNEIKLFENRYVNFLLRKVAPVYLQYPDPKYFFHLKQATIGKPDLIYSRSYPLSSTIAALKIKKEWKDVPWVLHLSDPWAISFEGDSPATNFQKKARKWNKQKELESFDLASLISFTSQKTVDLYSEYYPQFKHKFIISPNVLDEELINEKEVVLNDKLLILCSSGFGEKRDPEYFLESINEFLNENLEIRSHFRFEFTGPMTINNQRKFEKFNHLEELKHHGVMGYEDMLSLQRRAHVLVNIDSDIADSSHSVFFPSKLLEYMAANRRILAITNSHSNTHAVVKDQLGDCVDFNKKGEIKNLFLIYHDHLISNEKDFFMPNGEIEKFGAKYNAKILEERFSRLLKV